MARGRRDDGATMTRHARIGPGLRVGSSDGAMTPRRAEDPACAWTRRIEPLARLGLLGVGIVYIAMGGFAASAAVSEMRAAGAEGAAAGVTRIPGGRVLLWLSALGLVAAAASAVLQACTRRAMPRWRAAITCAQWLGSAVFYGSLAWVLIDVARHSTRDPSGDEQARSLAAVMLAHPFGRVGGIAIALAVMAYGTARIVLAIRAGFLAGLPIRDMAPAIGGALRWIGRCGIIALGTVAMAIGAWLLIASATGEPGLAQGIGGAITTIRAFPGGNLGLLLLAVGLILYGLHHWLLAIACPVRTAAAGGT